MCGWAETRAGGVQEGAGNEQRTSPQRTAAAALQGGGGGGTAGKRRRDRKQGRRVGAPRAVAPSWQLAASWQQHTFSIALWGSVTVWSDSGRPQGPAQQSLALEAQPQHLHAGLLQPALLPAWARARCRMGAPGRLAGSSPGLGSSLVLGSPLVLGLGCTAWVGGLRAGGEEKRWLIGPQPSASDQQYWMEWVRDQGRYLV